MTMVADIPNCYEFPERSATFCNIVEFSNFVVKHHWSVNQNGHCSLFSINAVIG